MRARANGTGHACGSVVRSTGTFPVGVNSIVYCGKLICGALARSSRRVVDQLMCVCVFFFGGGGEQLRMTQTLQKNDLLKI